MTYEKLNLNYMDRVKIIKTDSDLDGRTGLIYGKSIVNIFDHYIVVLDGDPIEAVLVTDSYVTKHKAIVMTEVCLEKLL